MHKIEFISSFFTKFWLFSSERAENSENGYLGFLTMIKESNVFILNIMLHTRRQYSELLLLERRSWLFAKITG